MFKKLLLLSLLLSLALSLLFTSCERAPAKPTQRPLLLVSIAPYRFLTERIAGPGFDVQAVVPMAANPHSFEPTASQVALMGRGIAWFRIGEPFEAKILPILQTHNPKLAVQDLREGIALIEESGSCSSCSIDHLDRHIWLSPKLAAQQAALIERTLNGLFPEQAELFRDRLTRLCGELLALDEELHEILKPVEKRVILVSHPAFGYFGKEYRFEQLSVEYEGKDPRPKHLEEILKKGAEQNLKMAIALPQHNNKGVQMIGAALHVPIRFIDPYSERYFEMMRQLAHLLADPHAN